MGPAPAPVPECLDGGAAPQPPSESKEARLAAEFRRLGLEPPPEVQGLCPRGHSLHASKLAHASVRCHNCNKEGGYVAGAKWGDWIACDVYDCYRLCRQCHEATTMR